jgi:hypothetical protein
VVQPQVLEVPELPFLQIVQVQPTILDFDNNDYEVRAALIRAVINYLVAPPPAIPILPGPGSPPPLPRLASPPTPWLVNFPEMYCPVDLLLDEIAPALQPGQLISTGICPLRPPPAPAVSFFDLEALLALQERLSGENAPVSLKTPEVLSGLIQYVGAHGGVANLAATLTVEGDARASLILHSKLAPSQFECSLALDENTVPGRFLHPITLKAPDNRSMTILLLICSDLIEPIEATGRSILKNWPDQRGLDIDLINVLNVQRIDSTSPHLPLWPIKVRDVLRDLLNGNFGPAFQATHVLLTNVGSFQFEAKVHTGGQSSFVVRGNQTLDSEVQFKLLSDWNGNATLFGFGAWATGSSSLDFTWYDHEAVLKKHFVPHGPPILAQLRPAPPPGGVKAVVQVLKLRLNNKFGLAAVQGGQLLAIGDSIATYSRESS